MRYNPFNPDNFSRMPTVCLFLTEISPSIYQIPHLIFHNKLQKRSFRLYQLQKLSRPGWINLQMSK